MKSGRKNRAEIEHDWIVSWVCVLFYFHFSLLHLLHNDNFSKYRNFTRQWFNLQLYMSKFLLYYFQFVFIKVRQVFAYLIEKRKKEAVVLYLSPAVVLRLDHWPLFVCPSCSCVSSFWLRLV
jgi:hypothetical protein